MASKESFSRDEIDGMSPRQLRVECENIGLDKKGRPGQLKLRLTRWSIKQIKKKAILEAKAKEAPDLSEDLICPITRELPFDPAIAEDGRMYERSAILKHFESQRETRSPYTNEPMGRKLFPATQFKSHIQNLIDRDIIVGDAATHWNERKKEETDKKQELLKKAEHGSRDAMWEVAICYGKGDNGFPMDRQKAHVWTERAHSAGLLNATAQLGRNLLDGFGTEKDDVSAVLHLSMAAAQGCARAAFILGEALLDGTLPTNKAQARRMLEMAVNKGNEISPKELSDAQVLLLGLEFP